MTDSPETRRARELLASSEKLLEEVRNRPRVEISSRLHHEQSEHIVAVPVVRKTITEARVTSEHPAYKVYADRYFLTKDAHDKYMKGFAEELTRSLFKLTDALEGRIKGLEAEVSALKQRQPAPVEEWPLRSIKGGKRRAGSHLPPSLG